MKLLYLDTNVILTKYAPDEPQHEAAKKIVREVDAGNPAAVISVLTLIEIASVTSRAQDRFAEARGIVATFLRRVASIRNLIFCSCRWRDFRKNRRTSREVASLFAVTLEIASKIGLKTLDNLHLAAAMSLHREFMAEKSITSPP